MQSPEPSPAMEQNMSSHPPPRPPDYGIVRRVEETTKKIQDAAQEATERSARKQEARRQQELAERAKREQERKGREVRPR